MKSPLDSTVTCTEEVETSLQSLEGRDASAQFHGSLSMVL
jgi:hypothetical protein